MKVSFILPIYNKKPEYLKRCLNSLVDQSYKEIEIITVFDGKDDVLESIADTFPVVKVVKENGGASSARNAGLDKATGDIVVAWDCDCYIEPDICASWVKLFNERPDIDFIYSNYGFTDPAIPGFRAEPFDPWKLTKYNYICSMTPIRKEKALRWDESLKGLQDWDYFRRMAEAGCQGGWLDHKAFETELPDKDSISGSKDRNVAVDRIKKVKEKHGDVDKDILVVPGLPYHEVERMAKYLDADIFNIDLWRIHKYKTILLVGFSPEQPQVINWAFRDDGATNLLLWMGGEAEVLLERPWGLTTYLIKALNKLVTRHLCVDKGTQDRLAELGIKAEIINIPRDKGEVSTSLPEKLKVLIYGDELYQQLVSTVVKAMPDVSFTTLEPNAPINLTDFTAYVQFTKLGQPNDAINTMLINGRHVVSNVKAPYAGYIPLGESIDEFKGEVIKAIRNIVKNPTYNQEAHDFYKEASSPERFVEAITKPKLEVI